MTTIEEQIIKNCALEWQFKISQKQWKIFHSNTIGDNISEKSLLTRKYFAERKLDEAFKHVVSCNKSFSKYLKDFIALLRGEKSVSDRKEICNLQNQCYNTIESWNILNDSHMESLNFSLNQHSSEIRKTKSLVDNTLMVQTSFADVIKAKVNFDTKFLGFEAVLQKNTSLSTDTPYKCHYCSKIMKTTHSGYKKSITADQRSKTIRKSKRLLRSAKTLSKKREVKESSLTIDNFENQLSLATNTSFY
ncbi:PREDICTED: uncharacterized protein LOC107189663 [Dufourea novaeangliae]|uniref:uncharacterized protein LOC107189663 n=1 Tax=Dufourea novaeangliae TaxID=178035 RepID=UPI0007670EE5|nr:PREDICTED: uncharacterized protein LOC107189663 [Dufourea novaeangliae]